MNRQIRNHIINNKQLLDYLDHLIYMNNMLECIDTRYDFLDEMKAKHQLSFLMSNVGYLLIEDPIKNEVIDFCKNNIDK